MKPAQVKKEVERLHWEISEPVDGCPACGHSYPGACKEHRRDRLNQLLAELVRRRAQAGRHQ